MPRPELLMTRGDTLAAQASLALGILTDKDVVYALFEHAVIELDKVLVDMEDLLNDETFAQEDIVSTTKVSITLGEGEDIDTLRAALGDKTTVNVYRKSRRRNLDRALVDINTWYQLYSPGFLATDIKRRHLDPVVDRINDVGNPDLAAELEVALEAFDGWNLNVPFYEGDLQAARTTQLATITGRTGPFVVAPGANSVELDGLTPGTWTLPPSTPAVMYAYKQDTLIQIGAKANLTFDAGAPGPFTTKIASSLIVTMDATVVATCAGAFGATVPGMVLKVGASYYEIMTVVSANVVRLDGSPGAGVYPACEIHYSHTFPLVINSPGFGIDAVEYTIDLLAYGTFSQVAMMIAIDLAVGGPGVFTYTDDGQRLLIELNDEDDRAYLLLPGNPAGPYPLLYDAMNVTAGSESNGRTDTTSVSVFYRASDGSISTIGATLTPPAYPALMTPAAIAADLNPQLAIGCTVTYDAAENQVVLTGLTEGTHAFLYTSGLRLELNRVWGTSSSPSEPPAGFILSIPENTQQVGPHDVYTGALPPVQVLDGTDTFFVNENLSGVVDLTWKVGVQLAGFKHVAYYDPVSITFGPGTTTVQLAMPPFFAGFAATARFVKRPVSIQATSHAAGAFIEADTSLVAQAIGISGARADGRTTDFFVPDGTKAGYYVLYDSEYLKVVTLHDDGSATLDTGPLSELPEATTLPDVEVWSPGAESMSVYRALDNTAPPAEIILDKEGIASALSYVSTMRALINSSRHTVLESSVFQDVLDFCDNRKLEIMGSMLKYGSVAGFFSTERGSMRSALSSDGTSYSEHNAL